MICTLTKPSLDAILDKTLIMMSELVKTFRMTFVVDRAFYA